jgi:hypothetical protein
MQAASAAALRLYCRLDNPSLVYERLASWRGPLPIGETPGMSQESAPTIVYVTNADSREILVWRLRADTGELSLIERVPVTGMVMPLAISPSRRHLYASLRSEPFSIACFAVDRASGRLTHVSATRLPDQMCYLATDRTGRFLLSASYQGSLLTVHPSARMVSFNLSRSRRFRLRRMPTLS